MAAEEKTAVGFTRGASSTGAPTDDSVALSGKLGASSTGAPMVLLGGTRRYSVALEGTRRCAFDGTHWQSTDVEGIEGTQRHSKVALGGADGTRWLSMWKSPAARRAASKD